VLIYHKPVTPPLAKASCPLQSISFSSFFKKIILFYIFFIIIIMSDVLQYMIGVDIAHN
jgi:hypothetical protein